MAQAAIRFNNNPQYPLIHLEQLITLMITHLPLILILPTPRHIAELTKSPQDPQDMSPHPQPESPSIIPEELQYPLPSNLFLN